MKKEILMTACVLAAAVSLTACSPAMLAALGASASSTQQGDTVLESQTLVFRVHIPAGFDDAFSAQTSEREVYGGTVTTITVTYQKDGQSANVCSIELMDQAVWEKMQAEGGPLGTEIARSEDGRVAVMTSLQSNPFAEGTAAYETFQQLPSQLSILADTFEFLE